MVAIVYAKELGFGSLFIFAIGYIIGMFTGWKFSENEQYDKDEYEEMFRELRNDD